MLTNPQPPQIHLPKGWQDCVQSAVLHAIAMAHYAIVYARAWAADSINARVRLSAENDRLQEACALLREELRIKDTRIAQIAPQRRPHYGPHERMAILDPRASCRTRLVPQTNGRHLPRHAGHDCIVAETHR